MFIIVVLAPMMQSRKVLFSTVEFAPMLTYGPTVAWTIFAPEPMKQGSRMVAFYKTASAATRVSSFFTKSKMRPFVSTVTSLLPQSIQAST